MADVTSPFGTYKLNKRKDQFLRWGQGMPVSWLGRRAALLLRRAVLEKKITTVDAVVDGLKLRLYMQDNVSERKFLFMPQFFDRYERNLIKNSGPAGGTFVDSGAKAGIYPLTAAAAVGANGRVLAIEPNPAVLDRLKYNLALNNFTARVIVEQACVSDHAGTVELTLDDTNLGGSSLVETRSAKTLSVACYPLLAILQKYQLAHIDALKIDIEGAEDMALIPFLTAAPPQLLPRFIILENSKDSWKKDLQGTLKSAGYSLIETTRMNLVWSL